jgi:hypothetical protein
MDQILSLFFNNYEFKFFLLSLKIYIIINFRTREIN